MRRIGVDERRARLALRHRLAAPASDPVDAARRIVALHATDPATVFLAVQARAPSAEVNDIERALYENRSLVRMLGMRRTMFVVPTDLVPVVQASCTEAIATRQWRTYTQFLEQAGVGDRAWLEDIVDSTARALATRGEATAAELSANEPRLRTKLLMAEGKSYASQQNITTWVLFLLAAEGRIVRGRPRGTWTSSQYTWSPAETWLPGGAPEQPVEAARVELVRRWLGAFGPGTIGDLKWWTGWTLGQVKLALAEIQPDEVQLDGATGLVLPGDVEQTAAPDPWVALLPALDPTAMGWTERSWYLGDHAPVLFDRSGNVGPTVWSDGRIVGGWAQRTDGRVVYRLLEDVGTDAAAAVEAAAGRLETWIGAVRVTPRFRTPLERELTS